MSKLSVVLAACVLAGCGHREKSSADASPPGTPMPTGVPKYRGSATTTTGLHADVAISAQGDYTVSFMDAAGDDLPAAQASGVSIQTGGRSVPLQMNDTGETWIGKGALPAGSNLTARVAFSMRGQADLAVVSLTAVDAPLDFVCPMDPDVRSAMPGVCPRCGMKLEMGIADPEEYPLRLHVVPAHFRPREKVELKFGVETPNSGEAVTHFQTVHERLFHLFIVSSDLQYFVHDHPKYNGAGEFHFTTMFPKPGMYRVLGDFYPSGGTPQLAPQTIFVPGSPVSLAEAKLTPDTGVQKGQNLEVDLVMDPPRPIDGSIARLYCRLKPVDGLEKYLGAWGHMLAASDDLIDLLHEHPFSADNGQVEFDLTFPRARVYRVWIQFQRKGVVNTVAFNVPVQAGQP